MKLITLATVFLLSLNLAYAEDSRMSCSSSDGAIRWEEGTAQEGVLLKYSNFVEGTLELDIEEVNIDLSHVITFKEELFRDERLQVRKKVTVAKAIITASEKFPDVLKSLFPENKVQGEVICTNITLRQK